ncbi:hypothetical protein [Pseudaeromonas paramecii]|uniref:DUF1311 domain-containing protein n=1 Tax=Pseudaeromonas paramecii TaxID=2138166 RepID=A0ABP8Q0W2_9GAMM
MLPGFRPLVWACCTLFLLTSGASLAEEATKRVPTKRPPSRTNDPSCRLISDAVNRTVCERTTLVALDKQLKAKMQELAQVGGTELERSHDHWFQRRNACAQRQDIHRCLELIYAERMIELDWRYHRERIVAQGPIPYHCPEGELAVSFLATEPPAVVVQQDAVSELAFLHPDGMGVHYRGVATNVDEQKGAARIQWQGQWRQCQQQ